MGETARIKRIDLTGSALERLNSLTFSAVLRFKTATLIYNTSLWKRSRAKDKAL